MREPVRKVVLAPLLAWGGLLLLLSLSLGYAYIPAAPLKSGAGLAIAAAKIAIIVLVFVQFRKTDGLIRIAAAAGLLWLSLLFLLTFADLLTR